MSDPTQTIAAFADYIAAFNRGDFDGFTDHYTDDVELTIANGTHLKGRQAIIDFYRNVRAGTERTIRVVASFADENGLAAELESEFLATEDVPDFTSGPMRKGDRLYIRTFALYELEDGRFARIRSAPYKREWRRAG